MYEKGKVLSYGWEVSSLTSREKIKANSMVFWQIWLPFYAFDT
jgi:hypothetical protein